ncbi:hypothetical protein HAX54_010932, partial [Datura stramonium]|nr:hypothetical protein [Datura stramonium]
MIAKQTIDGNFQDQATDDGGDLWLAIGIGDAQISETDQVQVMAISRRIMSSSPGRSCK